MRYLVYFAALMIGCSSPAPSEPSPSGPLPDTSIYQLSASFRDQNDRPFDLASLRGEPVVIAMFYSSCTTVCPMLISDIKRIEREMPGVRVVLVTIDPERDTTERLHALMSERDLPAERWTLLRGTDDDTRQLAMLLGVQYRRAPGGHFAHSALITLLDRDGNIAMQLEGVGQPVDSLVRRARLRS